jgi:oligopeptide transport system ATP-binding protein
MALEKMIQVKDLKISFYTDKGRVQVIRGISFDLYKGEVLCIVGESGSGKSVTAKTIMGILPGNGRIDAGSIMYQNSDLTKVSEEQFHQIRGKKIGMIFQDPLSSLNPIMRVGKQITEAMIINGDKVKRKYNDLILPELIKYENNRAQTKGQLDNARSESDDRLLPTIKALTEINENPNLSKEAKATQSKPLQAIISAEKAALQQKLKQINQAATVQLRADYVLLKARKKSAKKEANAYRISLSDERNTKLQPLKQKLSQATSSEEKQKLLQEIRTIRTDFINSIRLTRKEAKRRAIDIMKEVGISYPEKRFKQYPFEFSGGMRQRIVIAIALTQDPDILILDEPTTALDVTIQAQILDLIKKLKTERALSCIFITHDLGVVANMADRIAVMYAGKIVEYGKVEEIFYNPQHPYTWALLSSIPDVDARERLESISGTPPNLVFPPIGDAFAARSKYAMAIDFKEEPPFFKVSDSHYAATWLLDPRAPKVDRPKSVVERIEKAKKMEGAHRE